MKSLWAMIGPGLLALAVSGCGTGPIYTEGNPRVMIGSVPDRRFWKAYGTVGSPAQAIDGNIHTAAVANDADSPARLLIDLGKAGTLNMIVIDHGPDQFGFAREVEVHTSLDGRRWIPRHAALGTRRVTTLLLMNPVLARYIRLDAVVPGTKPWSLAEIHMQ